MTPRRMVSEILTHTIIKGLACAVENGLTRVPSATSDPDWNAIFFRPSSGDTDAVQRAISPPYKQILTEQNRAAG